VNTIGNSLTFAVTDPVYIGQYTVSIFQRANEDNIQATYDAYFAGRSYEADRIASSQFTLSVEPCISTIVQTPTTDMTYYLGLGAVDTGAYTFLDSANCNYGFTTTATGQPAFASHTPTNTKSGNFRVDTMATADFGAYDVTVTATLDLTTEELAFYTDAGFAASSIFTYTLTVAMCEVTSFIADVLTNNVNVVLGDPTFTTNAF